MGNIQDRVKGNTMQKKPKNGDLFDRGAQHDFELVPLTAHRNHQCITIHLGDEKLLGDLPVAIDYANLTGGGVGFNAKINKRVKIWKAIGT